MSGQDLRCVWPQLLKGTASLPDLRVLRLGDGSSLSGIAPADMPAAATEACAHALARHSALQHLSVPSAWMPAEVTDSLLRRLLPLTSLQVRLAHGAHAQSHAIARKGSCARTTVSGVQVLDLTNCEASCSCLGATLAALSHLSAVSYTHLTLPTTPYV